MVAVWYERFSMKYEYYSYQFLQKAAHCVIGEPQTGILVVAGTLYLDAGGARHQSARYIMHPQYDDWTLEYE